MSRYNVEYVLNLKDRVSAGLKNIKTATNTVDSGVDKLKGSLKNLAAGYLGAEFIRSSVLVAAEFEKLEAVLANTLGSKSAAAKGMAQIEQFAVKTPYEVKELSDSFIKLANRGAKPTNKQMTAMGDVAAVLGKDFSELTEAILDVNNTQRWTELGLKAKTVGDKVQITFKGMTYEVDRTEQGILGAIEAMGQMEGVAGTMGSIMDTTAGKISNFSDIWTKFQQTSGQAFVEIESSLGLFAKGGEVLTAVGGMVKVAAGDWTQAEADYNTVIKSRGDMVMKMTEYNQQYLDILINETKQKETLAAKTTTLTNGLMSAYSQNQKLNTQLDETSRYDWTGSVSSLWENLAIQAEASKQGISSVQSELYTFLKTLDDVSKNQAFEVMAKKLGVTADAIGEMYKTMNFEETAGLTTGKTGGGTGSGTKKGGRSGSSATSSTLMSRSPQTFNINITKLVETINTMKPQLNTTDSQTMRQITEALVSAVNDVQNTVK